ncbi:Anti-sigma regulatory factor (Ser/Thr protein kinase) [Actinokineospora alba]|uniref:Anti-sigma regulatory factor (Ser/Thr protein kinase) n=1 Tax=Actinokineospora alba TaxID=504798 RepID=A0A1H0JAD4_9PSEU|nr:ATP-binding protein [Actinokineospora alba]TDP68372.1 anti-sigma regulatory factor (Ser/Thr protein kinase) [Actinokineospora alba]SDH77682.1 Anti-sigma regulatory factor (Ser/Thr protein kinase) [Actinokineospora alba]SDO40562.1 Anti-sigma regulatory factor (Ser/Thr protein kinase) [Actinokineospora alba]
MVDDRAELIARLLPTTRSAGEARDFVSAALRSWACDEALTADVVLATSELVTNAMEHGRGEITVDLRLLESRVLLRVRDEGPGAPVSGDREVLAPRSRGLTIVEALSTSWGWQLAPGGKWVWAEFPFVPASAPVPSVHSRPPAHH